MASRAILDIGSEFDNSGTNAASAGVGKVGKAMDETNSRAEGLFKRMERPLGRTLFASLASEMVGVGAGGQAASGGVMALERGFHALSSAGMYLTGTMGTVALVAAGLVALFLKINSSGAEARKGVEDHDKAIRSEIDVIKERARALLKDGEINQEQYDKFLRVIEAKKRLLGISHEAIKTEASSEEQEKKSSAAQLKRVFGLEQTNQILKQTRVSAEHLTKAEEKLLGIGADSELLQTRRNEALARHNEVLRMNYERLVKAIEKDGEWLEISELKQVADRALIAAENDYKTALEGTDKAVIESAKNRMEAAKAELATVGAAQDKLKSQMEATASQIMRVNTAIASNFKKVNGQIIFDFEKFASSMVQQAAEMLSKQLVMWALMDFATGNIIKGGAELAASAAVSALGGIAGTWGPGEQTGGGGLAVGGGSGSGNGEGPGPNQVTLNVNIEGGMLDNNSAQYIARALNDFVQQSNGVVIASNIRQPVGQAPGV